VSVRFLFDYFLGGGGSGHVQSLVIATLCITLGALMLLVALLADMISANRKLLERANVRLQRLENALIAREPGTGE